MTTLGCCRQVGRAAFLLTTPQSKVLIDCGESPGATGAASSPYLHVPEIYPFSTLDAVVLTHAHLDHSAYIPLLYRYGYDGPVYTTPATRDLAAMLQLDYLDVNNKEDKAPPYSSNEVREFVKHTITLGYGDVTDIAPDLKLTLHNAGHILGSAIAHFNVGNGLYNIAFTGDLYYAKSRLFNPAVSQFSFVRGIPQVPGGYYSWRNVNNAFYTVTTDTDTASPREELMDKVVLINSELAYKWEEFELTKAEGGE